MKLFINKLNIARAIARSKFSFSPFLNWRLFMKRLNTTLSVELRFNPVRLTTLNILSSRPTGGSGEIYNPGKISLFRFAASNNPLNIACRKFNDEYFSDWRKYVNFLDRKILTLRLCQRLIVGSLISLGLISCASDEVLFARYDALCHQGVCVAARPTEVFYTHEINLTWEPAVYFGYDLDFMQESEIARLDRNLEFLTQYQDLKISLQGFADSTASRKYNMALSLRRVESVRDYLMQNGISSDRIQASHGGESLLINSGNSIEDQIINRRVEMMLLDAKGRPLTVGLEPRGSDAVDFVPPTPEKKVK